ncbi:metalloprotease PmbA [Pseudomarimonas salicorniae]|uniref:Metalloprotease PmbA n=1 Tax=Pseudomarimonas salicorniae TaxID=2933270 RepID=A0ABT0GKV8_9GAMM|nr:metalloprotease PmbA [Lysobacter sp. CAU 1642]MCK7594854.1 metalloprotease PmbA [Lysobacter sp. CAU 1642]
MNTSIAKHETQSTLEAASRLDQLASIAEDVLSRCRARGASQAEVGLNEDAGLSANVRMGEVETIEYNRDRGLSLTVYFGQRKGSASTADLDPASIELTIDQACAIARFTEEDACAGLAEASLMAREFPEIDVWHPRPLDADEAVALALRAEAAGRAVDSRIGNSDGSSTGLSSGIAIYANSHGFLGREQGTSYSLSCSLIAGQGEAMQRDYWYDAGCRFEDLADPESIGRRAAERALARLAPRSVKTGEYPVLFSAEVARSLFGHLVAAVSGGALYRQASFLLDHLGKPVLAPGIDVVERPHLRRGHRSAAFDDEGVATRDNPLVADGVLQRYVLGSYSARKLGLTTTANAGGVHNLEISTGSEDREALIRGMGRGLLVTELMGQGANLITGDYSRGAAGFWIENGEIAYPVDELTIAGNLRDMLLGIEAIGCDIDRRSATAVGSVLVGRMTVAGDS